MNGLLNNNFLFGFLLSKDLPRQEQLMVGLSAGQSREPMAAMLLKPVIDLTVDESTKRVAAEKKAETLASAIEIVVPLVTGQVQLRVPAATAAKFVRKEGTDGATLNEDGFMTFPDDEQPGDLTLAIAVDGVERPVVVRRRELSQIGAGTGATTRAAMRRPAGSTAARSAPFTGAAASSARGERADIEAAARAPGDGDPEEGTGDIAQKEQTESSSDQSARRKSR